MSIAFDSSQSLISAALSWGERLRASAAAPATCGAEADVPGKISPRYERVVTRSGATSSGLSRPSLVGPCELKDSNLLSRQATAPTVSEPRASAGVPRL